MPFLDFSGPGFSMASILGFSVGGVSLLGFLLLVGFSCHKKRRKKRPAKWYALFLLFFFLPS